MYLSKMVVASDPSPLTSTIMKTVRTDFNAGRYLGFAFISLANEDEDYSLAINKFGRYTILKILHQSRQTFHSSNLVV